MLYWVNRTHSVISLQIRIARRDLIHPSVPCNETLSISVMDLTYQEAEWSWGVTTTCLGNSRSVVITFEHATSVPQGLATASWAPVLEVLIQVVWSGVGGCACTSRSRVMPMLPSGKRTRGTMALVCWGGGLVTCTSWTEREAKAEL